MFSKTQLYLVFAVVLISCAPRTKEDDAKLDTLQTETITLDQDGQNCLSILIARDGTINRVGGLTRDSLSRNFFVGMTKEPIFDNLADNAPEDLLMLYTEKGSCDTTGHYSHVKIVMASASTEVSIEHCVNGSLDDQPKPIVDYIHKAVSLTDPWFREQLKMITH